MINSEAYRARGLTRRQFVAAATAAALVPRVGRGETIAAEPVAPIMGRELALAAIDAARRAGAEYADVRLTRTLNQSWMIGIRIPSERQDLDVGVRALVGGYWGFVASPVWTMEEMARLGAAAATQARINARGKVHVVEWLPVPPATGTWSTPLQRDPFSLPFEEVSDFFNALGREIGYAAVAAGVTAAVQSSNFQLSRQEKTFASTEGALFGQTIHTTGGGYQFSLRTPLNQPVGAGDQQWVPRGTGWEYFERTKPFDAMPALIDAALALGRVPVKPVDIGRYDLVCDALTMAELVDATVGAATQIDRALGYEANAGGTSYLNDPLTMVGDYRLGTPLVTISGDRSMPEGIATVRWDDDGVAPADFTLVKGGVLTDFQTTRDQAAWLKPYYDRRGLPLVSHGCATAPSARYATMQHTPNLTLHPGASAVSVDDLIADTANGIFLESAQADVDFQCKNGTLVGRMREIKSGKLGAYLANGAVVFDAPSLWQSVVAIGGPATRTMAAGSSAKGEPQQGTLHSINAVPAKLRGASIIDRMRKL